MTDHRYRVEEGDESGPPVMWIHGFLCPGTMWYAVLDAMAVRPLSGLVMLPGHSMAPWYPEKGGFDGTVEALATTLPFDKPVVLVGYSMGARLALALALAHPDKVAGAVLVGADVGIRDADARAARAAWDDAQAKLVERVGMAGFVKGWAAQPLFATQQSLPAEVTFERMMGRLMNTPAGVAWALRNLGTGRMTPRWEALAGARVPLCFVAGGRDAKFAAVAAEAVTVAPRGVATVAVVEGAGHDVALEIPGALSRTIDGFIAGL